MRDGKNNEFLPQEPVFTDNDPLLGYGSVGYGWQNTASSSDTGSYIDTSNTSINADINPDQPPTPLSQSNHDLRRIPKWKVIGAIGYASLYLPTDVNLDAFLIKEGVEYISNDKVKNLDPWIVGCALCFMPNFFWMLAVTTVLLRLDRNTISDESADADSDLIALYAYRYDDSKWYHWARDITCIGAVSGMMSAAGLVDTVDSFTTIIENEMPPLSTLIGPALLSALIDGFADTILHRHFVKQAINDPNIQGSNWSIRFLRSLLDTFVYKVWQQETWLKTIRAAYLKYGILVGTGLRGYFATDIFSDVIGLKKGLPGVELAINIPASILLAVVVGNTKARNIDRLDTRKIPALWWMVLVLGYCSVVHAQPSALQFAKFGQFEEMWQRGLFLGLGEALFMYPNAYGYYATTLQAFYDMVMYMGQRFNCCKGKNRIERRPPQSQSNIVKLISSRGFLSSREEEDDGITMVQSSGGTFYQGGPVNVDPDEENFSQYSIN